MSRVVAPPASSTWDHKNLADRTLAALRLRGSDVDADRVAHCATVAARRIDRFVDRPAPPPPDELAPTESMVEAAVDVAVRLYVDEDLTLDPTEDLLIAGRLQVRDVVLPDRRRWGVA